MNSLRHLLKSTGVFFDRILNALFAFSGVLLAFATLSIALGIVSRYFFDRPWGWVIEISEYILLYIAFLIGAWVLRHEGHVKMDIIINLLPPKAQAVMNTITSLISATVCLVIAVFGARVTLELYRTKAFTYTILELPKFIIASVIFIGASMLFVQFLRRTYGYWAHSNGSDKKL